MYMYIYYTCMYVCACTHTTSTNSSTDLHGQLHMHMHVADLKVAKLDHPVCFVQHQEPQTVQTGQVAISLQLRTRSFGHVTSQCTYHVPYSARMNPQNTHKLMGFYRHYTLVQSIWFLLL